MGNHLVYRLSGCYETYQKLASFYTSFTRNISHQTLKHLKSTYYSLKREYKSLCFWVQLPVHFCPFVRSKRSGSLQYRVTIQISLSILLTPLNKISIWIIYCQTSASLVYRTLWFLRTFCVLKKFMQSEFCYLPKAEVLPKISDYFQGKKFHVIPLLSKIDFIQFYLVLFG